MENLHCFEIYDFVDNQRLMEVQAYEDHVILQDNRVLENMLNDELAVTKQDYCSSVQSHIAPHMRKIVTDWMLEVCEFSQVVPITSYLVSYLHRQLCHC